MELEPEAEPEVEGELEVEGEPEVDAEPVTGAALEVAVTDEPLSPVEVESESAAEVEPDSLLDVVGVEMMLGSLLVPGAACDVVETSAVDVTSLAAVALEVTADSGAVKLQ